MHVAILIIWLTLTFCSGIHAKMSMQIPCVDVSVLLLWLERVLNLEYLARLSCFYRLLLAILGYASAYDQLCIIVRQIYVVLGLENSAFSTAGVHTAPVHHCHPQPH